MADQLTTIAKVRLISQLETLNRPELKAVEHAVKIQLGLPLL
jgi:mRNA-degrading endonuclease toxin of MazEF toxin-antitoxin module